ncbi:MAG: hypothetical protein QOG23_4732 [Blastocatellia bacterium]|jgi:hypothetical protein|nr:hypothetical protein [Blastocatellia bacterium]
MVGVTSGEPFDVSAVAIAIAIDPQQLPWLIVATFLFALLALAILFLYTYKIQSRSYVTMEKLGLLGKTVTVTSTTPFVRAGDEKESLRPAEQVLKVAGPRVVSVGVESAEFTATIGSELAPSETKWTITPATVATLNSKYGPVVKVIAAKGGAFTLAAELSAAAHDKLSSGVSPEALADLSSEAIARLNPEVVRPGKLWTEVQVAAIEPVMNAVEVPFVGRGYGSMAMAIVLVAAVIILGLAGTLSGEGVATLLGGLLGYIFGVAVPSASASKKQDEHKA